LTTGKDVGFSANGATSVASANDNKTLCFGVIDNTLRFYRIMRQQLDAPKAELVYEESDLRLSTYVTSIKTTQYIFISSASSTTADERFIPADKPMAQFRLFLPHVQDVEYSVYPHRDKFFVRYKDKENLNGKIYEVPLATHNDRSSWKEFLPHDETVR